MIIHNGLVFGEEGAFEKRDLYVERGRIVADASQVSDGEVVDAEGLYVLPGLVDVHSHGAVGKDFSDGDPDGLREILRYEREHGVTSYCPTGMTLAKDELLRVFDSARDVYEGAQRVPYEGERGVDCETQENDKLGWAKEKHDESSQHGLRSATIVGLNMEGPFLAAGKKGAHKEAYIVPAQADFFGECNRRSGGLIRLVTLAPETEGALDFIEAVKSETNVSLGHSAADYETAMKGFRAGANHVTHLYNAMLPFSHREPGLIGAAMEADCMVELIADGVHIHECVVRATFRMFPGRVVLISDSMRATGMADGTYDLGGQEVTVRGKVARLADGTIAGSVTNLYDCMRTAISFGVAPEEAIASATRNQAKSIGMYHEIGSLAPGKRADVLLADREFRLVKVF
jgi:N-acetylglucosamine-6-phosphate deacetylase